MKYPLTPIPKPRMTARDCHRPQHKRYFKFCDDVKALDVQLLPGAKVQFNVPMPKSWSMKKKAEMNGRPHIKTPDLDNYIKALSDAIYGNDSHMWRYSLLEKRWAYEGSIVIVNCEIN